MPIDFESIRERAKDAFENAAHGQQKTKLIVIGSLAGLLVLVAGYNLIRSLAPAPRAEEPQSKDWALARELNDALAANALFHDTAFHVDESQSPPILKLSGQLKTQKELAALQEFIKQQKPDQPTSKFDYSEVLIVK